MQPILMAFYNERMNEAKFTQKVNKSLTNKVYTWKISDRFTSGIPDSYYSGNSGDLWVEYKFLKRVPKSLFLLKNLSELQKKWLLSRHKEGRPVAVIVGYEDGAATILPGNAFEEQIDPSKRVELAEVTAYIIGATCA